MTSGKYLATIGFVNPVAGVIGMDDSAGFRAAPSGLELIAIPAQAVVAEVRVKVLLVDFPDRVGVGTGQG